MALEVLRQQILEQGQSHVCFKTCGKDVTPQEASMVLLGLQSLQRIRGDAFAREELLMDPLFEFAVAKSLSNRSIDDVVGITSCLLLTCKSMRARFDTVITIRRQQFQIPKEFKPALTAVECAPGVASLARNPVASATLCGWESDVWFASAEGALFVDLWNTTHAKSLPCLVLPKDETIVAVVFFGLQTVVSMLHDMKEDVNIATQTKSDLKLTDKQSKSSQKQVLANLRNPFVDVVSAAHFLAFPLDRFSQALEVGILDAWFAAEDVRLASSAIVDTSNLQSDLSNAFAWNRKLAEHAKHMKECASQWLRDADDDADAKVADAAQATLDTFEQVNRAVGSLQMTQTSEAFLQGLVTRMNLFVARLQKPFRGTCVQSLSLTGGNLNATTHVSVHKLELTANCWNDVETKLSNLPNSTGAGIACVLQKRVLLPLSSLLKLESKWIGGKVENEEQWLDAAFREFDEETFLRADPWVDRFELCEDQGKQRVVVFEGGAQAEWMQLVELEMIQEKCKASLFAESKGLRIVRHVDCKVPYPRKRINTRRLLRDAFDNASKAKQAEFLRRMCVLREETGSKSYNTLVLNLEVLLGQGRIESLLKIPDNFVLHHRQILQCQSVFPDVFDGEVVNVDWDAVRRMEQGGFVWIDFDKTPPRIQHALKHL